MIYNKRMNRIMKNKMYNKIKILKIQKNKNMIKA